MGKAVVFILDNEPVWHFLLRSFNRTGLPCSIKLLTQADHWDTTVSLHLRNLRFRFRLLPVSWTLSV